MNSATLLKLGVDILTVLSYANLPLPKWVIDTRLLNSIIEVVLGEATYTLRTVATGNAEPGHCPIVSSCYECAHYRLWTVWAFLRNKLALQQQGLQWDCDYWRAGESMDGKWLNLPGLIAQQRPKDWCWGHIRTTNTPMGAIVEDLIQRKKRNEPDQIQALSYINTTSATNKLTRSCKRKLKAHACHSLHI